MDIVGILKLLFRFALVLVPISAIILIITAFFADIAVLAAYITDNPIILIASMTLDKLMEINAFAIPFSVLMVAGGSAVIFMVFD